MGIIAYLLFLVFIYETEGESVFFWIWAGIGIFVVLMGVIGMFIPETPEEKAKRKRENRIKDEIAAMVIGLSDD